MKCPNCNESAFVYSSKHDKKRTIIKRNRKCKKCGWHVTTFELQEDCIERIAGIDILQDFRDEIRGEIIAEQMRRVANGF